MFSEYLNLAAKGSSSSTPAYLSRLTRMLGTSHLHTLQSSATERQLSIPSYSSSTSTVTLSSTDTDVSVSDQPKEQTFESLPGLAVSGNPDNPNNPNNPNQCHLVFYG